MMNNFPAGFNFSVIVFVFIVGLRICFLVSHGSALVEQA
jgi:hypothetical protein